jgi:DNA-cytosine methyltransferase
VKLNILSLFDGISCAQIALNRAGIDYTNYFASEIDKCAIDITQYHHPNTIQLGNVAHVKIKTRRLSEVMCYINSYEGNNIQRWEVLYWLNKGFTLSAKIATQKTNEAQEISEPSTIQRIEKIWFSNREIRSIRLREYIRGGGANQKRKDIYRRYKNEQFIVIEYENGFHIFKGKIDILCGGSPCQGFSFAGKQLNFNDPRSKLFFEFVRLLNELKPDFFVFENVVMKKEYENIITENLGVYPIKINSALVSAQNRNRLYFIGKANKNKKYDNVKIDLIADKNIFLGDIIKNNVSNANLATIYYPARIVGRKINLYGKRCDNDKNIKTEQYLEVKSQQKSNCVTTVLKDTVISKLQPGKYSIKLNNLKNKQHYRYITPLEAERLQTLPDNYTNIVSNSKRYKLIGNAWTIDVIEHIFNCIFKKK